MGGASTGVIWGGAPDAWVNPATRVDASGVGYGGAGDASENSAWHAWSVAGSGLAIGGTWGDAPHDRTPATRGVALSAAGLRRALGDRDAARFGDIADLVVGFGWTRDVLANGGIDGAVTARDRGLLVRVTPFDTARERPAPARLAGYLGGTRVDVTFGGADLNYGRAPVVAWAGATRRAAPRADRYGWAIHASTGAWTPSDGSRVASLWSSLQPLIAVTRAWDHATWSTQALDGPAFESAVVEHAGWEVVVANVVAVRGGRAIDHARGREGTTSGLSVAVPLGGLGGVRWDRATTPAWDTGAAEHRSAISAWVAPRAVLRRLRLA